MTCATACSDVWEIERWTRSEPNPTRSRFASPVMWSVGIPAPSVMTSISCQAIRPRQPVFNAFRKASFAAKRAANDWAAALPLLSQYSRSAGV